jgi:hypothetical protein
MIGYAIAIFIGLMLGWCCIPQPKWAEPLWNKFTGLIKGLKDKFKDDDPVRPEEEDDTKFKG